MRIKKITVRNFRSLEVIEDLELPQLCALVGSNNTGKSNILESIRRVLEKDWITKSSFEQNDIFLMDDEKEIEINLTLEPQYDYQHFKSSSIITKVTDLNFKYNKYKVGDEKGAPKLDKKCLGPNGKVINVPKNVPKKGEQPTFIPLNGIPQEIAENIPLIYIGTDRSLKSQMPGAYNSLLGRIFDDINADFLNPENKISIKNKDGKETQIARYKYFNNLIEKAVSLLKTKSFTDLEHQIKVFAFKQLGLDIEKDSEKLDFYFTPPNSIDFYKSLDLIVKEGSFSINACELGKGFQNILVIAILKAFEERRKQGAIILIEEPEMYLHPQTQRSLYNTLREVSKTNQVIYTTHSSYFVNIADYQNVIMVTKNNSSTSAKRSDLNLDPNKLEKFRRISNSSHNEFFFAKRVLFVEGDTEENAFPEWARKEGFSFNELGVSVIEVSGKNNLLDYAAVAKSFNIPVGVVYDTDLPTTKQEEVQGIENHNASIRKWCNDNSCLSWPIPKDYETHLKSHLGDELWNKLCEKYQDYGDKKQKQRLIAADEQSTIPALYKQIVTWLASGVIEDNGTEVHEETLNDAFPF